MGLNLPATRTVATGQPVTLSVGAICGPLPYFQWFRNGVPVSDATNATLFFRNPLTSVGGNYFVVLSNSVGVVTSAVATLSPSHPVARYTPHIAAWKAGYCWNTG